MTLGTNIQCKYVSHPKGLGTPLYCLCVCVCVCVFCFVGVLAMLMVLDASLLMW